MIPTLDFGSFLIDLISTSTGILIMVVILLLVGLRLYVWCTLSECKSKSRMDGKVVIVTGSDSGIGKETAKDLARRGAKVVMACLDLENAYIVQSWHYQIFPIKIPNELPGAHEYGVINSENRTFAEELVNSTGNNNIVVRGVDLSSLSSVREFAEKINREEERLDVLIHNAGTADLYKKQTEDGLELTMATNHYGPFLLTHLLIDLLKKSAPSRIVVVASTVYQMSRLNLVDNPNPTSTFGGFLYFISKYANVLFTLELARRLQGSGVTANCLHPGAMSTGIWKNCPWPGSWIVKLIIAGYGKTPEQGAQTSIHLAVSDEVAEVSGKYFQDCQEHSLTRGVQDAAKGKKFWELSEGLVKLRPTDPKI